MFEMDPGGKRVQLRRYPEGIGEYGCCVFGITLMGLANLPRLGRRHRGVGLCGAKEGLVCP